MNVGETVKYVIRSKGMTQKAVAKKMCEMNPNIKGFTCKKLSAIITNNRKMTCDEFLAFCLALEVNPNVFMSKSA